MAKIESVQQLGLSTLEQGATDALLFNEHFVGQYVPALRMAGYRPSSSELRYFGQLDDFMGVVSDEVIRKENLSSVGDFGNILPHRDPSLSIAVSKWHEFLGGFNPLVAAEDDLLLGARILLNENLRPAGRPMAPLSREGGRRTLFEFVRAATNGNFLEQQQVNRSLLTAAQMVHQAGWLALGKVDEHRALMSTADAMYSRICDSGRPLTEGRMQAGAYRADIRFHFANQRLRMALAGRNGRERAQALTRMSELMRERGNALQDNYRLFRDHRGDQEQKGTVLHEPFVIMALRDSALAGAVREDPSFADYEVRSAFRNEGTTPGGVHPRSSFDLLVQHYDDEGIATTPVECKMGRIDEAKERELRRKRLPGITMVIENQLTHKQVYQLAEVIMRRYVGAGVRDRKGPREYVPAQERLGRQLLRVG